MTSRVASLLLITLAACGSDPPKSADAPIYKEQDKTEVKMERTPIADAEAPEPVATGTAPATIASPAPSDPADDPNIGGPQDEAVERGVAPIRPRIRACYKKALVAEPAMKGNVTFDTTLGKDGKVASVRFVKKDGLSDDMVNCLSSAMKGMIFAADRKTQVVAFAFGPAAATPR